MEKCEVVNKYFVSNISTSSEVTITLDTVFCDDDAEGSVKKSVNFPFIT